MLSIAPVLVGGDSSNPSARLTVSRQVIPETNNKGANQTVFHRTIKGNPKCKDVSGGSTAT